MQEGLDTISIPVAYIELFVLMFGSFLIGYLFAWYYHKKNAERKIDKANEEIKLLKREISHPPRNEYLDYRSSYKDQLKAQREFDREEQEEIDALKLNLQNRAFSEEVVTAPLRAEQKEPAPAAVEPKEPEPEKDPKALDFERLGTANFAHKDDLQKIIGIGPYTEEKLNDIGIFTYRQISKFNDQDIELVTELIKFFPDRIKNDRWVQKAKDLMDDQQGQSREDTDEDEPSQPVMRKA
ncbi:hypothetical protein [Croceiramulus getboli]|nr:hypothetical protein P8624_11725 [Flavobacteriaceae bacterium YJPT1-3]